MLKLNLSVRHLALALFVLIFSQTSAALELNCKLLDQLFQAYRTQHISIRKLDAQLKQRTVNQYIENLDGTKTMLLASDVEAIKKDILGIFDKFEKNDCSALQSAQKILLQRAKENEEFTRSFLNAEYKLDETVEFTIEAKKRNFATSVNERNVLLKKLLHFQIANYILGDVKLPEAREKLIHRYELISKRIGEKSNTDILNEFADAYASAMDPHSSFLSQDKLEEFKIDISLSLEGIGASLSSQDGYTVVEEIIPGGAADKAKVLQPKDKIIAVGQDNGPYESVIDMDLKDVVKKIRGKKGTKVRLTVIRQGEKSDRLEITIVRDKVDIKESAARINYEKRTLGGKTYLFGVIELPSFYGAEGDGGRPKVSSSEDVKKLLTEAKAKKVSGIVLDMSRNGGGLLDEGTKIAGLFIKEGPVVATQNNRGQVDVLSDTDANIAWSGPLVILTSRASASASEIVAGALKDYRRALIVGGDHTFGKGTVQTVIPLPQGLGAMKTTIGMFFVAGGQSTQHTGVIGDIVLPHVFSANEEISEKGRENSLPPQKIQSFMGPKANSEVSSEKWNLISDAMTSTLKAKSADRVRKDPKFAEIQKDIEEIKKNQGIVKLAEVLKKSDTDKKKKKDDEKKSSAQRSQEANAPYTAEAVNILTDWIALEKDSKPQTVFTGN
jgi:carboxyl-terminal processing protease